MKTKFRIKLKRFIKSLKPYKMHYIKSKKDFIDFRRDVYGKALQKKFFPYFNNPDMTVEDFKGFWDEYQHLRNDYKLMINYKL